MQVLDGYCRFTALRELGVQIISVYLGSKFLVVSLRLGGVTMRADARPQG
jgi:hypothetical protein